MFWELVLGCRRNELERIPDAAVLEHMYNDALESVHIAVLEHTCMCYIDDLNTVALEDTVHK